MLRDAADDLARLHRLPRRALEEDLVHQPARAAQQGDQTPHRRRRRLPQPRRAAAAGRRRPGRGPRRMAGRRPPLPLRRLHGPHRRHRDRHDSRRDHPGGSHRRTHRVIVSPTPRSRTRMPAVTPRGGTSPSRRGQRRSVNPSAYAYAGSNPAPATQRKGPLTSAFAGRRPFGVVRLCPARTGCLRVSGRNTEGSLAAPRGHAPGSSRLPDNPCSAGGRTQSGVPSGAVQLSGADRRPRRPASWWLR